MYKTCTHVTILSLQLPIFFYSNTTLLSPCLYAIALCLSFLIFVLFQLAAFNNLLSIWTFTYFESCNKTPSSSCDDVAMNCFVMSIQLSAVPGAVPEAAPGAVPDVSVIVQSEEAVQLADSSLEIYLMLIN